MAAKKTVNKGKKAGAKTGIEMAIEWAGTQAELARHMGVGRSHVHHWKLEKKLPPNQALKCEKLTGVNRHYLNPEVYPEIAVLLERGDFAP